MRSGSLRTAGAVFAGFAAVVLLSTGADMAMRKAGVFPQGNAAMSNTLFLIATAYRAIFTIAGSYLAAALAGDGRKLAVWVLAAIGQLAGIGGVFVWHAGGGSALGPAWYAYAIALMAIPCVIAGGWLRAREARLKNLGARASRQH
jgi:hypothetical protein